MRYVVFAWKPNDGAPVALNVTDGRKTTRRGLFGSTKRVPIGTCPLFTSTSWNVPAVTELGFTGSENRIAISLFGLATEMPQLTDAPPEPFEHPREQVSMNIGPLLAPAPELLPPPEHPADIKRARDPPMKNAKPKVLMELRRKGAGRARMGGEGDESRRPGTRDLGGYGSGTPARRRWNAHSFGGAAL